MTQVQTMTNPELNRALAVLMGWKAGGDPNKKRDFVWWIDENRFRLPENWDPCTDPAASLEVQTAACAIDKEGYIRNIVLVKWGESPILYSSVSNSTAADIACASPRERAEAAYITIQGATRPEATNSTE